MSNPTEGTGVGADRRAAERKSIHAEGELRSCAQFTRTQPMTVKVCDVSASGVGIIHSEPLPPGAQYVVKQASFTPEQPRLYTVARTTVKRDGSFVIGLQASHSAEPAEERPMAPKPARDPFEFEKNFGAIGMACAYPSATICRLRNSPSEDR